MFWWKHFFPSIFFDEYTFQKITVYLKDFIVTNVNLLSFLINFMRPWWIKVLYIFFILKYYWPQTFEWYYICSIFIYCIYLCCTRAAFEIQCDEIGPLKLVSVYYDLSHVTFGCASWHLFSNCAFPFCFFFLSPNSDKRYVNGNLEATINSCKTCTKCIFALVNQMLK